MSSNWLRHKCAQSNKIPQCLHFCCIQRWISIARFQENVYGRNRPINSFISDIHKTRGNDLHLKKSQNMYDLRKCYFINRVVDIWNSLPNWVVTASNHHHHHLLLHHKGSTRYKYVYTQKYTVKKYRV